MLMLALLGVCVLEILLCLRLQLRLSVFPRTLFGCVSQHLYKLLCVSACISKCLCEF